MTRRKPLEKIPPSASLSLAPGGPAIVTISRTVADLLACAARGEKVVEADLANLLATISAFHTGLGKVPAEYQGVTNAPVPIEILALVGEALVGRIKWAEMSNARRADEKRVRKMQVNRRAAEILDWHPGHTKSALARIIADETGMKPDTVRKLITLPKK